MRKGELEEIMKARSIVIEQLEVMMKGLEPMFESLKKLDKEQKAAVISLLYSSKILGLASNPILRINRDQIIRMEKEMRVASDSMYVKQTPFDMCMDEMIAYASALASCRKKGVDEEHCYDSWDAGADLMMCQMGVLDSLKKGWEERIDIFRDLPEPDPIPWPIEEFFRLGF